MALIDNFDLYNDGDLNGQGDWSGDTDFNVQGIVVQGGAKAVKCVGVSSSRKIDKSFTAEAEGNQVVYMRDDTINSGIAGQVGIHDGAATVLVFVHFSQSTSNILFVANGGSQIIKSSYSTATWYKIEFQWSQTAPNAGKFRARVNDGAWSNWDDAFNSWSTANLVRVYLHANASGGNFYWDSFFDPNAIIQKSVSDFGSGVDAVAVKAKIGISESGQGQDNIVVGLSKKILDTGSGADEVSVMPIVKVEDQGQGQDLISLIKAKISVSDIGSGVDNVLVKVKTFITDVGSGIETISKKIKILIQEIGKGIDRIKVPPFYSDKYSKQSDSYQDKYSKKGTTYQDKYF